MTASSRSSRSERNRDEAPPPRRAPTSSPDHDSPRRAALTRGVTGIFAQVALSLKPFLAACGRAVKDHYRSKRQPMYIIARNITGPRLKCEALMVDKKSFTPWPPSTEDGWRRAYKFRDRLMAEVVRLEVDPMGEELRVIEAVYIP
jgi:hypothetical protein